MQVVAETSSTVDRLTGAQPKILSRVGKLPKSARDHNRCTFLKTVFVGVDAFLWLLCVPMSEEAKILRK